jgi:transcriptional regulator with XRE-family HTH domain
MEDIRLRLGKNVRRLRRAADIKQESLAGMTGVSRTYVSEIERGRRNPSILVVEEFARALGVSAGSLLD